MSLNAALVKLAAFRYKFGTSIAIIAHTGVFRTLTQLREVGRSMQLSAPSSSISNESRISSVVGALPFQRKLASVLAQVVPKCEETFGPKSP